MVNTMGWNQRSDPDMRTANFCDVYREGVYTVSRTGTEVMRQTSAQMCLMCHQLV